MLSCNRGSMSPRWQCHTSRARTSKVHARMRQNGSRPALFVCYGGGALHSGVLGWHVLIARAFSCNGALGKQESRARSNREVDTPKRARWIATNFDAEPHQPGSSGGPHTIYLPRIWQVGWRMISKKGDWCKRGTTILAVQQALPLPVLPYVCAHLGSQISH